VSVVANPIKKDAAKAKPIIVVNLFIFAIFLQPISYT
jgi:hypothetical protein